jgi:hypothetical protein
MAAIGFATGALWLRFRAPVGDRGRLGLLGSPPLAVVIAVVLIVAGAVGESFLPAGGWLASVVVLDLIALLLLRYALQLGLLEEAAEKEVGPPITCANCGSTTRTHTFCGSCGIALKALPKARRGERGSYSGRFAGARYGGARRLGVYAASTAIAVAAAVIVAIAAAPSGPSAPCRPRVRCGAPPKLPHLSMTFPGYQQWTSKAVGYSLRYDRKHWSLDQQDPYSLVLHHGPLILGVKGAVQTGTLTPAVLMSQRVESLRAKLFGLARDEDPGDQVLGTNVGLRPGPGGVYKATVNSPQSPQTPVSISVMAAGANGVAIAATALLVGNIEAEEKRGLYSAADDVINSIEWAP